MKILSRDFTLREKISITVLMILIAVAGYIYLVHIPVTDGLNAAHAERDSLTTRIMINQNKIKKLEEMEAELDKILNDPTISVMPSYNNIKEELAFLNETLSKSYSYSINVADVTKENDQIRRDVYIQFTARDFDSVKQIVEILSANRDRTLISDLQLDTSRNLITCALYITFYETMVGGTPDTGLPVE